MNKIIKNQRGGDNLVIDNYLHEKRRVNKTTIKWYFTKFRKLYCPVSVTTDLNYYVQSIKGQHNHEPLTDSHIIFKEAIPELHEKACNEIRDSSTSICIRKVNELVKANEMKIDQEMALASKL